MEELLVGTTSYALRHATREDLPAIVSLLRDDGLGAARELEVLAPYEAAFDAITRDPNHTLVVVENDAGAVVATMQLTLLPGLSRGGATRLLIEGVRVGESARGTGLGTVLFGWAHDFGAEHGAVLAQLTTDKARADAHRFYERLGYQASHVGMKRRLSG